VLYFKTLHHLCSDILNPKTILISRTDSIGDVVLTLPMVKVLKDHFQGSRIGFIASEYTRPVINACEYVDFFIDKKSFLEDNETEGSRADTIIHVFPVKEIALRAKQLMIRRRIGTRNRLFHWYTCNKLVKLSRKNSPLHEAQLNLKLLKGVGIKAEYSKDEIPTLFGLTNLKPLNNHLRTFLKADRFNVIFHPKSQGSAREWGLENFATLASLLPKDRYNILVSGTEKERISLQPMFDLAGDSVTDITGMMNLDQFISFINEADGLVANSTGPLHIAAALGKKALGIYPPIRPMHPGRWAPLGSNSEIFMLNQDCSRCRNNPLSCTCIKAVTPIALADSLERAFKAKFQ